MGSSERLFKNTSYLLISTVIQKTVGLVLTVLLARYLGADGYGRYSFMLSIVIMADAVLCYGVDVLMIRAVARDSSKGESILMNVLTLRALLVPVFIGLVIVWMLLSDKSGEIKEMVLLLAMFHLFYSFNKTICSFFSGYERLEYVTLLDIAYSLSKTVFIVAAIYLDLGLSYIVAGISASYLLVFICGIIIYRSRFFPLSFRVDWGWLRQNLSSSVWFVLSVIVFGYYWKVDQLILADLLPYDKVGIYSAAFLFIDLSIAFSLAYFSSVYPLISRIYREDNKHFELICRKSNKFFLLIGTPIPFLGLFIVDGLVPLIYGQSFTETGHIVKIFLFAIPFIFLKSFMIRIAYSTGRERSLFFATLAVISFKVILNYLLIGRFGIAAAALVMLAVEILYTLLIKATCFPTEDFLVKSLFQYTRKPLLASGVMMLGLYLFQNGGLLIMCLTGASLYLASLFFLKAIDEDEWFAISAKFNSLLRSRN